MILERRTGKRGRKFSFFIGGLNKGFMSLLYRLHKKRLVKVKKGLAYVYIIRIVNINSPDRIFIMRSIESVIVLLRERSTPNHPIPTKGLRQV